MERRTPSEAHESPDGLDRDLIRLAASTREASFEQGFDDRVMDRIVAERALGSLVPRRPMTVIRALPVPVRRIAVAAAVVIVLVATGVILDGYRWRTVTVPAGAVLSHRLPDGSSVTLHPGSTLRYRPFRTTDERRILLDGEAFLDVVKSDAPFVVETFNAEVMVTGTRFNVRAWAENGAPETAVALVEGSVVLRPIGPETGLTAAASREIRLAAGETARVAPDGETARVDDAPAPSDAANWTRGGLSFRNRPLSDILRTLERRYDVRIRADASVAAGRTATYLNPETPELADVLDALSFALGLRYGRTADGWMLTVADSSTAPIR